MISALLLLALVQLPEVEESPWRIVVECARTDQRLIESTNEVEETCARPRLYFDLGIQFGGVAFNLRPPRDVLVGFVAGTGYGFRWLPDDWTYSDAALSIDLYLNLGFKRADTGETFMIGASVVVTAINLAGVGFGWLANLGFRGAPDSNTPVGLATFSQSW